MLMYLNTSHVKVNPTKEKMQGYEIKYLNTSHVKVNRLCNNRIF